MSYQVKEIYYTLQGEGARTGRAAVFLRFAGCNLWSGREKDRPAAICTFCDTDFVGTDGPGGGSFPTAEQLAEAAKRIWASGSPPVYGGSAAEGGEGGIVQLAPPPPRVPRGPPPPLRRGGTAKPYVVCTGGAPLLQLDEALVSALHAQGFEVAIESNGTMEPPRGIDWICVSPKAQAELKLTRGNELKLVYPQADAPPERFVSLAFDHFFLQPMDGPEREANTRAAIQYCLAHPQWHLSLQTHKLIGIP